MPSFAREGYEYCEYFSGSGAITCRVVRRTAELCIVRFRTADWGAAYDGFSIYVTAAIFPEHLRPADPQSPGVMNFVQALASEAAARQRHLSNCEHRANGQSKQENGQGAPAPKTCAKATQGNGVKPPPKPAKTPARARAGGADGHSLKPVRSIGGVTLADFFSNR